MVSPRNEALGGAPDLTTAHQRRAAAPSLGRLFRDLIDELRTLLRDEIRLARAEMTQHAADAAKRIGSIAIGGLVALLGAMTLTAALCAAFAALMISQGASVLVAVWLAPLIVGAVVMVAGYSMVHKGVTSLTKIRLTPDRAVQSVKDTGRQIKEKVT